MNVGTWMRHVAWATLLMALLAGVVSAQPPVLRVEWQAQYWNNINLEGQPVLERTEEGLDNDWGDGSPAEGVGDNTFSARWMSTVDFPAGTYRFATISDDGIRVWVGDELVIDNWTVHPPLPNETTVTLEAGQHNVVVEYFEQAGGATAQLTWERLTEQAPPTVTVAPRRMAPGREVIVTASGFPANTELTVGIGRQGAEPTALHAMRTDASGWAQTTLAVPSAEPQPGEPWVAVARTDGQRVLSEPFTLIGQGAAGPCGATYVVEPGDWLSRIAQRCGKTVDAILVANPQIENANLIDVGMTLTMPQAGQPTPPAPTPTPAPTQPSVAISPLSGPPGTVVDVTAQGFPPNTDVTVGVGRRAAEPMETKTVTTDASGALQTTMAIPAGEAQPGEPWAVLANVPGPGQSALSEVFAVTAAGQGPCGETYVVQPGDWLSRIAQRCGITVDALLAANPQIADANVIEVGTQLDIPQGASGERVTATTEVALNLRPFPAGNNDPLTVVPAGMTVPVLSQTTNGAWLRVLYDNREGWILASLVEVQGDVNNVPVLQN